MATSLTSYFIELNTLVYPEIPLRSSCRYRFASKWPRAKANLLKLRNSILCLASIGSVGSNETFDAFIGAGCWLPFRIQFLHSPDGFASLRFDDSQSRLLPWCGFDLLPIDDDTAKTATRSVLRVLGVWGNKFSHIRNNPCVVVSTSALVIRPLSSIRTTSRHARLVGVVFVRDAMEEPIQWIVFIPSAHVAEPV
jgi:hypothetical protein